LRAKVRAPVNGKSVKQHVAQSLGFVETARYLAKKVKLQVKGKATTNKKEIKLSIPP